MTPDDGVIDVLGMDPTDWNRLEDLVEIRGFCGGAAYVATLDGMPVFALNELALDFGDEDMAGYNFTPILTFKTVEARDEYAGEWLKPMLRLELEVALARQFRAGALSRDDLLEALVEIEEAYRQ